MLHEAFLSLILERGYDAVTVQDIAERADVGRSTFYAHFPDKEALLSHGFQYLKREVAERQKETRAARPAEERWLAFALPLFQHAGEHRDLYRALVGQHGGAVMQHEIRKLLVALVREELGGAPKPVVVQFVVGAYLAVLTWWLDYGGDMSAEEVDGWFRRLATPGLRAAR